MNERLVDEINATRERLLHRSGWRCEVCGKPLLSDGVHIQLAHRIPQALEKTYGKDIIHSDVNLRIVCSLECNQAVSVRKPGDIADVLNEFMEKGESRGKV